MTSGREVGLPPGAQAALDVSFGREWWPSCAVANGMNRGVEHEGAATLTRTGRGRRHVAACAASLSPL